MKKVWDFIARDLWIVLLDIFAVNLMMALGKRGLISPEKIGIIGFDDAPVAAVSHPALTTLNCVN